MRACYGSEFIEQGMLHDSRVAWIFEHEVLTPHMRLAAVQGARPRRSKTYNVQYALTRRTHSGNH